MEAGIKQSLGDLKEEIGNQEIIAIVYNPYKDGIDNPDRLFLKDLFDKNNYKNPLIILSGPGGKFSPGVYFPYIIKDSVKKYSVYIPRICGSALCYTLLKANKLYVGENTTITQIDPLFEYNGETRRAIKVHKDKTIKDALLKEKARQILNLSTEEIRKLIDKPSLIRDEKIDYFEFKQFDELASLFMNKGTHFDKINISELINLGANIEEYNGLKIDTLANRFIELCQDFAIQKDVRVIFVSSKPIAVEDEQEGFFICPLQ